MNQIKTPLKAKVYVGGTDKDLFEEGHVAVARNLDKVYDRFKKLEDIYWDLHKVYEDIKSDAPYDIPERIAKELAKHYKPVIGWYLAVDVGGYVKSVISKEEFVMFYIIDGEPIVQKGVETELIIAKPNERVEGEEKIFGKAEVYVVGPLSDEEWHDWALLVKEGFDAYTVMKLVQAVVEACGEHGTLEPYETPIAIREKLAKAGIHLGQFDFMELTIDGKDYVVANKPFTFVTIVPDDEIVIRKAVKMKAVIK